jgi:hypothetical protein
MNHQNSTLAIVVFVALLFTACSPRIDITYDYDKETDFSKYETYSFYGWVKGSEKVINSINQKRFENAVANELTALGLTQVDDNGDLTVSLFIQFDEQQGVNAYTNYYAAGPYGYRYGPGWGWGYGYPTTTYHEYDYLVGTLVIDIFDHQAKDLIWQGVASQVVDSRPDVREAGIKKVVKAVIKKYPVKARK